jgi:hypothetical protein
LLTGRAALTFLAVAFLLMALFFPFYFRFGLGKALGIYTLTVIGISIVFSAIAQRNLFYFDESCDGIFVDHEIHHLQPDVVLR